MQAPLAPQWFPQPTYEWVPVNKSHYQIPWFRIGAHPWMNPSPNPWVSQSPSPWFNYSPSPPNPWSNPNAANPWFNSSPGAKGGLSASYSIPPELKGPERHQRRYRWHAGLGEEDASPIKVAAFASDSKTYRPLETHSIPETHRRVRELRDENASPKKITSPVNRPKDRNLLADEFDSEICYGTVPDTPRVDRRGSGKSFLDRFSPSRKRTRPLEAIPINNSALSSAYEHDSGPPEETPHEIPELVALDPFLTDKTLYWDVRNLISSARDYSPAGGYSKIPLDRPAGLPAKVKIALISFVNEEYAWVSKQWGPVVVHNAFGPITLGDIFTSISKYFGECLRGEELKALVYTPETMERVERAWLARHKNLDKREHIDTPGVYRRIDLLYGPLKFHSLKIRWTGKGVYYLSLTLRDL